MRCTKFAYNRINKSLEEVSISLTHFLSNTVVNISRSVDVVGFLSVAS